MNLLIIEIVLIVLLIRVTILNILKLITIFSKYATAREVNEILKNPANYVRTEAACKFMTNMIWIYVFVRLLIAAFEGNIIIN